MRQLAWFGIATVLFAAASVRAAEPELIPFDTYGGYFVSNKFEPDAPASFAIIRDQPQFDRIFGAAFVMNDKQRRLPKDAFESKLVLAVIKRGKALVTYKVESASSADGVLRLKYSSQSEPNRNASFACPLIVSVPKGDYATVEFIEGENVARSCALKGGFCVEAERKGVKVAITADDKKALLDFSGPGIAGAIVTRQGDRWPDQLVLRFRLGGLESLTITSGNRSLQASVLSHGGFHRLLHLRTKDGEGPRLGKDNPCWMDIRAFDADGKTIDALPPRGGWFEMAVPKALLDDDVRTLRLAWIDFYR